MIWLWIVKCISHWSLSAMVEKGNKTEKNINNYDEEAISSQQIITTISSFDLCMSLFFVVNFICSCRYSFARFFLSWHYSCFIWHVFFNSVCSLNSLKRRQIQRGQKWSGNFLMISQFLSNFHASFRTSCSVSACYKHYGKRAKIFTHCTRKRADKQSNW